MTQRILPSWRDGYARTSILAFLDQVDQVPINDRVAVFDNDGTLWSEKPNYTQLEFTLRELQHAASERPQLTDRPEYRAILDRDKQALAEMGLHQVGVALMELVAGITPEEFTARVRSFFDEARHPDRGVPYTETRYRPMLELLEALRLRRFDVFVASGGGAEFVRVIGQEFYGVPPEGVVGSQVGYEFARDDAGRPQLLRTTELVGGPNEGPEKVPSIQRLLGRRPVVAGGNSPGDAEMLEYAMAYDGPSLALVVNHDDAEREYAYESVAGTFAADESITDTAARLGWTVASMRNDWETIFSE